jgi:glycosyltransferase involved in cell wall biosynthesis
MVEPIRVLHIITRMVRGGAQENTLTTVAGIHHRGWESTLVTGPSHGPEGSLEPECLAAGIRLIRAPELVREFSPLQDLSTLRRLTTLLRKERPHIVHTHTSKAGILGRLAARRAEVPVVVHTPHGHVFHGYGGRWKSSAFVQAERYCAPMADRLVALTPAELRDHLVLGVGRKEQWTVIHSGVDFAPFEACRGVGDQVRAELDVPAAAMVLGTVGRLVPVKGQRTLIDAFARLAPRYPRLHLLVVGDGPLHGDLVSQAKAQGLAVVVHCGITAPRPVNRPVDSGGSGLRPAHPGCVVHFLGLRQDVPRLLSAMDLFVLPSLNEGMGRVLVEAMAMELPCVASAVSGVPDVVEAGGTGLLVPPQNAESLAATLRTLLDDPALALEMGRRGRRKVIPEFSKERMIQKLEALYRELLHEKSIAPPPRPVARDAARLGV